MKIPGFTAVASLAKGDAYYYAAGKAHVDPRPLQPAQSETFEPNHPVPVLSHPGIGNCLKYRCSTYHGWHGLPVKICHWVVGWC
jgi:hypothetical protein